MHLIVLHGITGTGKTEGAKILENLAYHHLHPYGFRKRQLESLYQMEPGALDTQEGKAYVPPGMDIPMQ